MNINRIRFASDCIQLILPNYPFMIRSHRMITVLIGAKSRRQSLFVLHFYDFLLWQQQTWDVILWIENRYCVNKQQQCGCKSIEFVAFLSHSLCVCLVLISFCIHFHFVCIDIFQIERCRRSQCDVWVPPEWEALHYNFENEKPNAAHQQLNFTNRNHKQTKSKATGCCVRRTQDRTKTNMLKNWNRQNANDPFTSYEPNDDIKQEGSGWQVRHNIEILRTNK